MKQKIAFLVFGLFVAIFSYAPPCWAGMDEGLAAYERGDWSVAAQHLKPLADQGVAAAQARFGHMLIDGLGVTRDPASGLALLQSAMAANDPEAALRMADVYFNGGLPGFPRDNAQGNALLDRAAALNSPEALSRVGTQTLFGIGRAKDGLRAVDLLTRASAMGSGSAAELLGLTYLQGLGGVTPNHVEAASWLRVAANRERPIAQALLGDRYWQGDGTPQDHAIANEWYQKSATHGEALGMMHLGVNLVNGDGAARDVDKGIDLLTKASAKGNEQAAEQLGLMFWFGTLVNSDHARAIPLLRIAAKSHPKAQLTLGVANWEGDNTPVNHVEAVALFHRAAAAGNAEAQYRLSQALSQGDGALKDMVEAYGWATRAADAPQNPQTASYQKARDQILAQMTPEEVGRARAKMANWALQSPTPVTLPPAPLRGPLLPDAPLPPQQNMPGQQSPSQPPQAKKIGVGSGFVVNGSGVVITDAHVVSACSRLRVIVTDANQTVDATILVKDSVNDLAALKTGLTRIPPLAFRSDKPIRSGDGVVVVGYPLSQLLSREPNVTTGVVSAMAGLRGDARFYQITAPVQKGNSGGPAADMSGNVIGVIQSKLNAMSIQQQFSDMPENVNFATKGDLVRKFLTDNNIDYRTQPAKDALSAADVADKVKQSMVMVECEF